MTRPRHYLLALLIFITAAILVLRASFAYCISVWLLPSGIWGIVALLSEHKRQRREAEQAATNSNLI